MDFTQPTSLRPMGGTSTAAPAPAAAQGPPPTLASLAASQFTGPSDPTAAFTGATTAAMPTSFAGSPAFTAPTAAQAQATPGYQFTLQQGLGAAQNSAAAQGMLSSGNTLAGLSNYASGLADNTYQNSYNNALQAQQSNYGQSLSTNQQQAALQAQQYGQGLSTSQQQEAQQAQQYGQASNTYQMNQTNALNAISAQNNFTVGQGNVAAAQTAANAQRQNAATNLQQANYGEAAQTFDTNYQIGQNNQNTAFNENLQLAQLGSPGTPNPSQLSQQQSNLLTGQGNSLAAGQMGSANAYGQAFGNLSGLANQYALSAGQNNGNNNFSYPGGPGNYG